MDRPFVSENAAARKRLRDLIESMTDEQLRITLPNGWPVYVALAHLAFWDHRSAILIKTWAKEGISPSGVDVHVINDALIPFFTAIPPREAAELALSSAEAVDLQLEQASDNLVSGLAALGDRFRLYRADHRNLHLERIESVLKG